MKIVNLTPYWSFLLPVFVGVLLGAALGYFGQCSSGMCPLTSTWWRGAIYGGVLGLLFGLSSPAGKASGADEPRLCPRIPPSSSAEDESSSRTP